MLAGRIFHALQPELRPDASEKDIVLVRRRYGQPISILVCRLPKPERIEIGIGSPVALLLIHAGRRELSPREHDLMILYRLTRAEAKLMRALLSGQKLSDYSKAVGISSNTAKTYLKQVFAKTGASKQSDLFRRVLTNPLLQFNSE